MDIFSRIIFSHIYRGDGRNSVQFGSTGHDKYIGNPGADTFLGGAGFDVVDYSQSFEGVHVSFLDGGFGRGGGAQGDSYGQVEGAIGSAFDDILEGARQWDGRQYVEVDVDEMFDGRAGNDTIYGHGGYDEIDGGAGDDRLFGGDGMDFIRGGSATTGSTSARGLARPLPTRATMSSSAVMAAARSGRAW